MKGLDVRVDRLVKAYRLGKIEVQALRGLNMDVSAGAFIAIIGPSGSGKTTLLNILGGLDVATAGTVHVGGIDLTSMTPTQLVDYRRETVGHVFQALNLIPTLTATENIELPMIARGVSRGKRIGRAQELLEVVGLADRADHKPEELSGGEQQRVAMAAALANDAPVILADEPTGELDTESSRETIDLMHNMNHRLGTTFVIVTHDPAVARRTDRILIMGDGRIVREDIITDPYAEDLRMLRHSPLGRAVLEGGEDLTVDGVALFRGGQPTETGRLLRELLKQV
jgi:putative ABC transport system ATP-binding protein